MNNGNSNEDMMRALANSLPGTFKLYRGTGTGADENILVHLNNIKNIGHRIEYANNTGCLVEVISLRLQIIDFWLRVYFVNSTQLTGKREKEFGRLIKQCAKIGFDKNIYEKLLIFNRHRINAIHGYIVGKIYYEDLSVVVAESETLAADVIIYVLENCGTTITSLASSYGIGDMILNVPAQIMHLKASKVFETT